MSFDFVRILLIGFLVIGTVIFLIAAWFYTDYKLWKKRKRSLAFESLSREDKFIIFCYTNSSYWKNYIEEVISPRIEVESVILNYSGQPQWTSNEQIVSARLIYDHYVKDKIKNVGPTALFISSNKTIQKFIFSKQAFEKNEQGSNKELKLLEDHFFNLVDLGRHQITE